MNIYFYSKFCIIYNREKHEFFDRIWKRANLKILNIKKRPEGAPERPPWRLLCVLDAQITTDQSLVLGSVVPIFVFAVAAAS